MRKGGAKTGGKDKASCVVVDGCLKALKLDAVDQELDLAQFAAEIERFDK